MKIFKHENILNIYDEEENLINTIKDISFAIEPDAGKLIRNKITGFTTDSLVGVGSKDNIANYEEIEKG